MTTPAVLRPLLHNAVVHHTVNGVGGLSALLTLIGVLSPIVGFLTSVGFLVYYGLLIWERPTVQAWFAKRQKPKT